MTAIAERITVDPEQCGGRPCIRGMRIRVVDVLDLLANGLSHQEVLDELPDLTEADILACLRFARQRIDHPVVAASRTRFSLVRPLPFPVGDDQPVVRPPGTVPRTIRRRQIASGTLLCAIRVRKSHK